MPQENTACLTCMFIVYKKTQNFTSVCRYLQRSQENTKNLQVYTCIHVYKHVHVYSVVPTSTELRVPVQSTRNTRKCDHGVSTNYVTSFTGSAVCNTTHAHNSYTVCAELYTCTCVPWWLSGLEHWLWNQGSQIWVLLRVVQPFSLNIAVGFEYLALICIHVHTYRRAGK